jgi:simple sugar transport system ATP-binding protein
MTERGHALVFITHKLREVLAVSQRVTVLRGGHMVKTIPTKGSTRDELARLMVGRDILLRVDRPPVEIGEPRLSLRGVWANSDKQGIQALCGIDLDVRGGEILGIAGVSGNGQRELAEVIAGMRKSTRGSVSIDGQQVTNLPPERLVEYGLSYVPEERMRDGAVREFSVAENLILRDHEELRYSDGMFLNFRRIANACDELIQDFEIKTPSRETPLKNLSGGNIQKLILARELSRSPHVLIAAQPTRGVDIGATEYIHRLLVRQRDAGTATLLISEDLDEIQNLSDRIAVMYEGQIMGIVDRGQATVQELGLMMAGVRPETASY